MQKVLLREEKIDRDREYSYPPASRAVIEGRGADLSAGGRSVKVRGG